MLKRLRRHLNPSLVISMIALFAALGGGYAAAFSGSGTLQKGTTYNFPDNNAFQLVRSINGVGNINAKCDGGVIDQIQLENTRTSGQLTVKSPTDTDFTSNADTTEEINVSANDFVQWHISRIFSTSKTPQVDVNISVTDGSACSLNSVSVLALNTNE